MFKKTTSGDMSFDKAAKLYERQRQNTEKRKTSIMKLASAPEQATPSNIILEDSEAEKESASYIEGQSEVFEEGIIKRTETNSNENQLQQLQSKISKDIYQIDEKTEMPTIES